MFIAHLIDIFLLPDIHFHERNPLDGFLNFSIFHQPLALQIGGLGTTPCSHRRSRGVHVEGIFPNESPLAEGESMNIGLHALGTSTFQNCFKSLATLPHSRN